MKEQLTLSSCGAVNLQTTNSNHRPNIIARDERFCLSRQGSNGRRRPWCRFTSGCRSRSPAELLYTEDFNTNGDGTRYTTRGTGVVLLTVEGNQEPAYWNHNTG